MIKFINKQFTTALIAGALIATMPLSACGSSAASYKKSADSHMEKAEYDIAVNDYKEAITRNPDRADYYIAYGFALLKTGDTDNAIAQFDKAHLDKNNQIVRQNNKAAYRGKGIALLHAGRYADAEAVLASAAAISDADYLTDDINEYLALSYVKQGKYDEALDIYDTMIKSGKETGALYAARAEVYAAKKNIDGAVADLEKAISLENDNLEYYFREYELYNENDMTAEAKAVLEKASGLKEEGDRGAYLGGVLDYLKGDRTSATVKMGNALKAGINEASYYLARIAQADGDNEGAKAYYEKYKESVGEVTLAGWYDGMADCAIYDGDNDTALSYVEQGLALTDVSFTEKLLYKKVELCEAKNDYEAALAAANDYLKLYPDSEAMKKEQLFLSTRVVAKKS